MISNSKDNAGAKTVLIIEDDTDICAALSEILKYEGYHVACAGNGQEALDYIRGSGNPALILLDLMMPVMDGYQFRAEQQKDAALASIPVVVISADGRVSQKAASLGVTEYLKKPVELETLLNTVEHHCR